MEKNRLVQIADFGQSVWLDYIRRGLLTSGELKRLIEEDGLRGVTSNPAIFEEAIDGSHDYDSAIGRLASQGRATAEIYEHLAVEDVQHATDLFRPLFDRTKGRHGFVSIEVSPHLARDTQATLDEAHRLWEAVGRPNVMIKVPGTREGLPAIERLIADGINVNVTLLFGLGRYREVAEAYVAGLEARNARGEPIDRVASVASFFLSRIDVAIDPLLERTIEGDAAQGQLAQQLHGQVAIASAKLAYQIYKEVFATRRFSALAARGAATQRVLWASTSTKNPAYRDVKYVEPLIGPETVNTLPLQTLEAFRDHGEPAARLEDELDEARRVIEGLKELDIDLDQITEQLEVEGIEKFNRPFDRLMDAIQQKAKAATSEPV